MSETTEKFAQLISRAEMLARVGDWGVEAGSVNAAILKLDPKNIAGLNRLARWCEKNGRRSDAEGLYRRVLKLDPCNRIAENHLGELVRLRRFQRIADGLSTFEEAFQRGVEERGKGHSELEAVILERAERLAHHDAARVALAAAYRDLQRLDRAEAIYREVLRRGERPAARVGLAGVLRDRGRLNEARLQCQAVLKRDPGNEYALHTLKAIEADMRQW